MSVGLSPSRGMALAPVVTVGGSELAQRWLEALAELRVELAVRTIGRCTMRFTDPGFVLSTTGTMSIGAKVKVSARALADQASRATVFTGTITGARLEQRGDRPAELVVTAEDAAFGLARQSRAQTYLDMSYTEAVKKVLSSAGVPAKVENLPKSGDYILQTDTDLAFIDEIARRTGWDWVVHDGTFHFWPSWKGSGRSGTIGSPVHLPAGDALESFTADVSAAAPGSVTVRGWDPERQEALVATAQADRSTVPDGLRRAFDPAQAGKADQLTAVAGPADAKEAQVLADAHARTAGHITARGRATVVPELRPGVMADVSRMGPATGKYFVHEVEHVYRAGSFTTHFTAGDTSREDLAHRPGSFTHAGLVVATVTDVADPESSGRVKVKYAALSTEVTSGWARLATPGAGTGRGVAFLPEVNDEVLVGFEDGDVRRPVVLGGLWGARTTAPPELQDGEQVTSRRIVSRLGHVIEFSDGKDAKSQHVLVALAGGGHRLRLGKDAVDLEVPGNVPLRINVGGSQISLDGKGAVSISGQTVAIDAQQTIELSAMDVRLKAKGTVAASGAMAELKGTSTTTVQSSGVTAVKGGMVQIN